MRNRGSRGALGALLFMVVACDPSLEGELDDDRPHTIALASQVIDTRAVLPEAALRAAGGDAYMLVKFAGPATAEQIAALAARARIYTYLPHDTFLVRAPASTAFAADAAIGATWSGAWKPEYKVSRLARDTALSAPVETRTVMVTLFPDADLPAIVAAAGTLPGTAVVGSEAGERFSRVRLRVEGRQLGAAADALAAIGDVFWVDVEGRRELLNDTTIWVGQSGLDGGQATPIFARGIRGEGQTVGYLDTGVDPDSCYFRDPARGLPPTNACGGTVVDTQQRKVVAVDFLWQNECSGGISSTEWDTHGHGTHVGGTIAGDNLATPIGHDPGDGMAPAAKLVVQDCGFRTDDCADCPGIGCPVVDLTPIFQQAYDQGARIHTNSWGDRENASPQNTYTAACQDVDEFMWSHPDFLILFAAGNSGPSSESVGSPSTAKNTISVGATARGSSANSMASFSSCGPTADGRIKPDLTIPGSGIISARSDNNTGSNNCNTQSMSGTSMASPAAAGLAALVRQYYTDGFYPSGSANAGDAFTPSAALVKATLLNSTRAMTNAAAIPGDCQGWGRILLEDALFFTGQERALIATDDPGFPQGGAGQTRTFTTTVAAGQSLRATLTWTDFPSTPAAAANLNNDLDLEVVGPSGTFRGNVFASGQSTTGGSADRRNNVEQVLLAAPVAGTYTITVRAFNVPSAAQPFSLVVSGNVGTDGGGNEPPVASAGADRAGAVGAPVVLDGTGSTDPDGDALTYAWSQVSGPAVTLSTPNAATARFTPTVAGSYVLRLVVSDGAVSDDDTVVITVGSGPVVVFRDDFEQAGGWTVNAGGDTATAGVWERADPAATTSSGPKQLGTTVSGSFDLVTGGRAGLSAGEFDVDGGKTSIQSPAIAIPAGGTVTLSLSYYFAHLSNSSSADYFRVRIVGATAATVIEELGTAVDDDAAWVARTVDVSAFAGQTVRIVIEAADLGTASLVEAAVDDVVVQRL